MWDRFDRFIAFGYVADDKELCGRKPSTLTYPLEIDPLGSRCAFERGAAAAGQGVVVCCCARLIVCLPLHVTAPFFPLLVLSGANPVRGGGTIDPGASYDPVSQSLFLRGDFPSLGPEDGSGGYPNFVRLDGRNGVIMWDQAFAPALGTHMPLYCHRCNGTILVGNHYDDGFYGSIVDDDSASDHTEQAPGFFYKLVLDGTSVVSSSSVYGTGSPHINEIYMDQHGLLYMVGQLSAGDLTINGHTVSVTNPGDSLFIGRFDMVRW